MTFSRRVLTCGHATTKKYTTTRHSLKKMKTKVVNRKEGKLNVFELRQSTGIIDGHICSIKTEKEKPIFEPTVSESPSWLSRFSMRLAHGAKEWRSEGRIVSDSPKHDTIEFYSFRTRKNERRFLIDADQKNIKENTIFTVPEETFDQLLNQLGIR